MSMSTALGAKAPHAHHAVSSSRTPARHARGPATKQCCLSRQAVPMIAVTFPPHVTSQTCQSDEHLRKRVKVSVATLPADDILDFNSSGYARTARFMLRSHLKQLAWSPQQECSIAALHVSGYQSAVCRLSSATNSHDQSLLKGTREMCNSGACRTCGWRPCHKPAAALRCDATRSRSGRTSPPASLPARCPLHIYRHLFGKSWVRSIGRQFASVPWADGNPHHAIPALGHTFGHICNVTCQLV
jgi:hypothetical protein